MYRPLLLALNAIECISITKVIAVYLAIMDF